MGFRLTRANITMTQTTADNRFLIFVSYSCKDAEHPFLRKLRVYFDKPEIKAHATYFMAEDNPEFGADFIEKVLKALRTASAVLPFITEASWLSPWVNQEIGFARAVGVPVLPAFDPKGIKALSGMVQTTDACPIDDDVKIQALFEHIATLSKGPKARRDFFIELKGMWWSMFKGSYPMYLILELNHASDMGDALKSAFIEIDGKCYDTVDNEKLGPLASADFKRVTLKFFPTQSTISSGAKLVLQTVRGKVAEAPFAVGGPSGWRPPELWKDFVPY